MDKISARRIVPTSYFGGFGDHPNAIAAAFQNSPMLTCL